MWLSRCVLVILPATFGSLSHRVGEARPAQRTFYGLPEALAVFGPRDSKAMQPTHFGQTGIRYPEQTITGRSASRRLRPLSEARRATVG